MSRPALFTPAVAAMVPVAKAPRLRFGLRSLDDRLADGLPIAALHEVFATSDGDAAAAAGFALLLALRVPHQGPLVWLREDRARRGGRLYGLGLAAYGLDPDRLWLIEAADTRALLRAGADALACPALAAVIIEPFGAGAALDLTASRRLALAAAKSGVTVLALLSGAPRPSAAWSRWQVSAAPSRPLAANAPGAPAFAVNLLRHRGGIAGFGMILEWDPDNVEFIAPGAGAAPATAIQRTGAALPRRAA